MTAKATAEAREGLADLSEIAQRGYKARAELAAITAEWEAMRASLIRRPGIDIANIPVYW